MVSKARKGLAVFALGWLFALGAQAQQRGHDSGDIPLQNEGSAPVEIGSGDHSAPDPVIRPRFVFTEDFPEVDDSPPPAAEPEPASPPAPRVNTFAARPAPEPETTPEPGVNRFPVSMTTAAPAPAVSAGAVTASTTTTTPPVSAPAPSRPSAPPPPPVVMSVPVPASVEEQPSYLETIPQAVAAAHVLREVCLPAVNGEAAIGELLPPKAVEGVGPVESRMSGRPLAGRVWSMRSLEESFLVGMVDGRPDACQILVPSPFPGAVADAFVTELTGMTPAFAAQGAPVDRGNGITWVRYTTPDGMVADILSYPAVGGSTTSTVQLILE